jgi:hypothetical protein
MFFSKWRKGNNEKCSGDLAGEPTLGCAVLLMLACRMSVKIYLLIEAMTCLMLPILNQALSSLILHGDNAFPG